MQTMKIKKGDTVKVLSGRDRGKTGTVAKAFPAEGRIMIEGVNVFAKRARAKRQNQKGEVVQVPRPVNVAKVMIICPNCKKAVRIGNRTEGTKRVRFCRKCEATI